MRMRHIPICGLFGATVFSNHFTNCAILEKEKKSYRKQNVCFDFPFTFYPKHFPF